MSQEVDWLNSQAGVCKVDLYNSNAQKDKDQKVICFVDVSSLNVKDKDSKAKKAASQYSSISEPSNELDLGNLEEKEVIVIKDNEKHDHAKTEGAVCLFKQGSSDELSVVSWLNNDLQKYAVGFQHALTPSGTSQKHKGSNNFIDSSLSQNSDTSLKSAGAQKGKRDSDDVSCYVNKLCSLIFQIARKEITDKLEGAANKCIHQAIHDSAAEGKTNNLGSVSKTPSQTVNASIQDPHGKLPSARSSQEKATRKEDTSGPKKTSLFYGEMSNQSGCRKGEKSGDKQACQEGKQSGHDDSGTSVSKGLMVYANQVASDMMFSFMKTMKVQRKDGKTTPACVVLKRVILKHTKDIISDLIDSTMKNLHNVTGVLMTDSDFVSTVKKNLYNMGSQKSTEILEVMVKRLYAVLVAEHKDKGQSKSHSLAYTMLKTAFPSDSTSQSMQFATLKTQKKEKEKEKPKILTCAEKVSEHIIKEGLTMLHSKQTASKAPEKVRGSPEKKPEKASTSTESLAKDLTVTALMLIQQYLLQQTNSGKETTPHDSGTSSLGFVSRESHFEKAGKSQSSKSLTMTTGSRNIPQELNSQKGDISSILLSIIQKVLREAGFNIDDHSNETNKSSKQAATTDSEFSKKALSMQPNSVMDQFDNMDQVNKKFIDQLVESVMNLCLFMTKCNNSDLVTGDLSDEQSATGASSSRNRSTTFDKEGSRETSQVKSRGKQLSNVSSDSEVIVNNQHANSSAQNKELQAILQWMAASHFNVPNLSFMNEDEGSLKKLPLLAEKAAKKGCSVGDILQEVMRYFEKQQIDAAVGNVSHYGLMDWLLANL